MEPAQPRPGRVTLPRAPRGRRPRARARRIFDRLEASYPGDARSLCALVHHGAFQLLVATILSAQCTDERVNLVTPAVFERYPTPKALAAVETAELEALIRPTGFFRTKAANLLRMSAALVDRFEGEVPTEIEELTSLAGVGRKTANVVRSVAFGLPGLPVDTHVTRLSRRLGLTVATDPVKIEADLCELLAPPEWGTLSLRLILHGRQVCLARRPRCNECVLSDLCPSRGLGAAVPRPAPVKRPGERRP